MKLKVVKTENGEVTFGLDETNISVSLGASLTEDQTKALVDNGFDLVESDDGVSVEFAIDEALAGAEDLRTAGFEAEAVAIEEEAITEAFGKKDEDDGEKDDDKEKKKNPFPKKKEKESSDDDDGGDDDKKGKKDAIEEGVRYEVPKSVLTLAKARKALTEAGLSSTAKSSGTYVEFTVVEGEEDDVADLVSESVDDSDDHMIVGEGKSFSRVIDEAGLGDSFSDLKVLFEASVSERVSSVREDVMAEVDRQVEENTNSLTEGLEEITARAVGEWVAANESSMVDTAKARKGERLAEGLKALLEEVGIEIAPSSESDVERIGTELEESRVALEEVTSLLEVTRDERDDALRELAVMKVAEGADLTVSQRHRLEVLAESVDEDFEDSIWTLSQTHFSESRKDGKDGGIADTNDVLLEDNIGGPKPTRPDNPVNKYLRQGRRITFDR